MLLSAVLILRNPLLPIRGDTLAGADSGSNLTDYAVIQRCACSVADVVSRAVSAYSHADSGFGGVNVRTEDDELYL